MEEVNLQKQETEEVKENKVEEVKETKVEELKEIEQPKGYYLAEVTTQTGIVLVKDKKQISEQELLVKVANAVEAAGLFK